jgi:hypothetical protein
MVRCETAFRRDAFAAFSAVSRHDKSAAADSCSRHLRLNVAEVTVKVREFFVIPLAAFGHVKLLGSVFDGHGLFRG